MNNALPRLLAGMVATMRDAIIPHIEDEFARGQAFGVIYMLNSIALRATWSNEFLGEQLEAQAALGRELDGIAPGLEHAPKLQVSAPAPLPRASELEALRDRGDAAVCAFIDWVAEHRAALPPETAGAAEAALQRYMTRQLRWELSTSAKPMFEEISRGAEA